MTILDSQDCPNVLQPYQNSSSSPIDVWLHPEVATSVFLLPIEKESEQGRWQQLIGSCSLILRVQTLRDGKIASFPREL